jgi:serine/threonine protein kinase
MSAFARPTHTNLLPSDYSIGRKIMAGGWGTVHEAVKRATHQRVAMKFFGYTQRAPVMAEIHKEIDLMASLSGIGGVVQLEGIFYDTPGGMVPDKNPRFLQSYPVIVMEMVEGGDLFDRIANRNHVSEHYLAQAFRSAMEALQGIHSRGFIHR